MFFCSNKICIARKVAFAANKLHFDCFSSYYNITEQFTKKLEYKCSVCLMYLLRKAVRSGKIFYREFKMNFCGIHYEMMV